MDPQTFLSSLQIDDFLSSVDAMSMKNVSSEVHECNSEPSILVETTPPHRIRNATQGWLDIFRFSKDEIDLSNLSIITGHETVVARLHRLLALSRQGSSAQAPLILYPCASQGHLMCVQAHAMTPENGLCRLTMHFSDAVDEDQFTDSPDALMCLTASDPWKILRVSSKFLSLYTVSEHAILGNSLGVIQDRVFSSSRFATLLANARCGLSQEGEFICNPRGSSDVPCSFRIVPLCKGGTITQLGVTIRKQEERGRHSQFPEAGVCASHSGHWDGLCEREPSGSSQSSLEQDAGEGGFDHNAFQQRMVTDEGRNEQGANDQGQQDFWSKWNESEEPRSCEQEPSGSDQSASEQPSSVVPHPSTEKGFGHHWSREEGSDEAAVQSPLSSGNSDNMTVRLCARRKQGDDALGALGKEVEITREVIESLAHSSMKDAAQKLGISSSSLKKACRALGYSKWPQRSAPMEMIHYNSAYVRKVYSKYAANGAGPSTPLDLADLERQASSSSSASAFTRASTNSSSAFTRASTNSSSAFSRNDSAFTRASTSSSSAFTRATAGSLSAGDGGFRGVAAAASMVAEEPFLAPMNIIVPFPRVPDGEHWADAHQRT